MRLKGQLISVDFLIGVLIAITVLSIGVTQYNSISQRQLRTSNAMQASQLILTGTAVQGTYCYSQTTINDNAVLINNCQDFDATTCKKVWTAKRFTTINLTQRSCLSGCVVEVKTCEE